MYYRLLDNFIRVFLLLFIIHSKLSSIIISVCATSLNSPEEIKNIFGHADVVSTTSSISKGTPIGGNFVGDLIDVNVQSATHTFIEKLKQNSLGRPKNVSTYSGFVGKQNMPATQTDKLESKSHYFLKSTTYKTLQNVKLPENGSNLFLGVPEVVHVNGTSSIKPRKGVDFSQIDNKIIPHKGVLHENEASYSFLSNYSCFWLTNNDCYHAEVREDLECTCCKGGNTLGEIFKQQALVNCTKCKPILTLSSDDNQFCKSICCHSVFHDIASKLTTQDNFIKLKNNSKPKPSITKVPYDVDFVAKLLNKNKQKVLVPVVVSLLLLPFIGIFLFFIWQRTGLEYWDKRYYKKMDCLIDGIYND